MLQGRRHKKAPPAGQTAGGEGCLSEEFIHCFGAVLLAGLYERLGPLGMVDGVGVELGLQGHAGALTVVHAALALVVQEIAGVELDAGAVGGNGHAAAGSEILEDGTGVAVDLPVVVVACLEVQRLVVCADVTGQGLGHSEVHGRTVNRAKLAGGDVLGVIGVEEPAGHGQDLVHGSAGVLMAGQIEIAVVGEIEYGIPVCLGIINDVQGSIGLQGVSDPDLGVAGEALVAVGAVQPQSHGRSGVLFQFPEPDVEAVRAGVEAVGTFVGGEDDLLSEHGEPGAPDTVGVAAYSSPQESTAPAVGCSFIKAQHHIVQMAVLVGDPQPDQGGPKICDAGGKSTTRYCVQIGSFAGGQMSEVFFHDPDSFIFGLKSKKMVSVCFYWIIPYSARDFKPLFCSAGGYFKLSCFSGRRRKNSKTETFGWLRNVILYFVLNY